MHFTIYDWRCVDIDNKAQFNLQNPLILMIIFFAIIFFLIFVLSSDVDFKINIPTSEFEKGDEFDLNCEVVNNLLFGDINSINISYKIQDDRNNIIDTDYYFINSISWRNLERKTFHIDTSNFEKGEYTIWSAVHFYKYGILEAKYLSLKFTLT